MLGLLLGLVLSAPPTPPAPANFAGRAVTPRQVVLTWTFSGQANNFELRRNNFVIANPSISTRSYQDNSVMGMSTYTYALRSKKGNQFSNPVTIRISTPADTTPPPPAPTILTVTATPSCTKGIVPPTSIELLATVSTPGMRPGDTVTYEWSMLSGPQAVTYADQHSLSTSMIAYVYGDYVISFAVWITTKEGSVLRTETTGSPTPPVCN